MNRRAAADLEISAEQAARLLEQGGRLVDIRSPALRAAGAPAGSVAIAEDRLLTDLPSRDENAAGTVHDKVILICARGVTSLVAAKRLWDAGRSDCLSVAGGFEAWKQAGLPCQWPDGFDALSSERYARHLAMPQVGSAGQSRLLRSRVLLVGMGGLSSPAAYYLAAAGVGTLGLLDHDRVERSNLQRQILHDEHRVGDLKVDSAMQALSALNPGLRLQPMPVKLGKSNALELVEGFDVVIDGSDNFETRFAVNRACLAANIPLVYGAVMRFQGQASVFWPGMPGVDDAPCFRCFMPMAPAPGEAPSCAEAGVLGVLPGIIGTLQATEALKLLLGLGDSLSGRLLMVDALRMRFHEAAIRRVANCPDCGNNA